MPIRWYASSERMRCMATVVLQLPTAVQDEIMAAYATGKVNAPPHSRFQAKVPGCVVTVYNSGKVMFQGNAAESEAAKYGTALPKKTSTPSGPLPEGFANWSVVGSDEVGKGDFFGPLVVVAAYVPKEKIALVRELGVRDSKALNDTEIRKIARDLHSVIPYEYKILDNPRYNEMQRTMTQGKMTAVLHNAALGGLLERLEEKPDAILIDQFAERSIYLKHISGEARQVKDLLCFATKAEGRNVAVAAAWIIARAIFLKEMDKLSSEAGVTIPKGAGRQVDEAAARLIRRFGEEQLARYTKRHFANTKKAIAIASKSKR